MNYLYGPYSEFIIDGRKIGVAAHPLHNGKPCVVFHDLDKEEASVNPVSLAEQHHPAVSARRELETKCPDYDWDSPAFVEFCEKVGISPNR